MAKKRQKPSRTTAPLHSRPPVERMMRIHQAIRSGTYPNASTLALELEVSTKSVHRDLDFMRERLTLPLAFDGQRNGYYYTQEVGSFPTLQVTEGELFALLVAEKALQQYRGTSFEGPLLSAFKKMAASLPDTISLNLADWDQTISFRTSAEPALNLKIFDALAKATAHCQQIKFLYRKPGKEQTEQRLVDPYHLANINGEWFLFAYDHLRHAIRTFVPARIEQLEVTGKKFVRPAKFSLETTLRDSFGVHSGQGLYEVVIRFNPATAPYVREKRWHPSQELHELKGGELELRLRLSSLGEIQRWILGWGGNAIPLRPTELVASVKRAAQTILEHSGPR